MGTHDHETSILRKKKKRPSELLCSSGIIYTTQHNLEGLTQIRSNTSDDLGHGCKWTDCTDLTGPWRSRWSSIEQLNTSQNPLSSVMILLIKLNI